MICPHFFNWYSSHKFADPINFDVIVMFTSIIGFKLFDTLLYLAHHNSVSTVLRGLGRPLLFNSTG